MKKAKRIAQKIVDDALDFALQNQPDPIKRIKAYRLAANELLDIADEMSDESYIPAPRLSDDK